jgi:hypothetical protein
LVSGLGDAEVIGAAADRGCAIVEEGRVACWEIGGRARAVAVAGISGTVDLRVSPNVGCASDADGKVSCFWLRPKLVGAPIAVGEASSFAISAGTSDGALVCRARGAEVTCDRPNDLGGSWSLPSLASGKVVFERRITGISTGKYAACALDEDGAVACWGLNIGGVLGRPDTRFVQHPTAVPGIPDMKDVAVGDRFTCGLAVSGEVLCWGRLPGVEAMEKPPPPAEPTPVAGISGAKRLIANSDYACAYSDADEATCFFAHPIDGVYAPARVPILDRARFVRLPDLGFANAVAAIDENGQLLVGPTSAFDTLKGLTLAPVAKMVPAEQLSIVSLGLAGPANSYGFVLSRGPKGHVVSVEIGDFGARPPQTLAGLDGALALNDAGYALLAGGKVVAGRLGRAAEVIVAESPLVTLSDGSRPCGLTREGTYGCMTGDRFVPVFDRPVKVASSGAHDCELGADRRIRCRGSNTGGECGVSIGLFSSDEPREIPLR